jgi:hypothetical protein
MTVPENKEIAPDDIMAQTAEAWKTLGTMMFTNLLLSLRDDIEPHVLEKHHAHTEQYRQLMVRQTKIALKMRDQK